MKQAVGNAQSFYKFIPYGVGLSVGKKLKEAKEKARLKMDSSQMSTQTDEVAETTTHPFMERRRGPSPLQRRPQHLRRAVL